MAKARRRKQKPARSSRAPSAPPREPGALTPKQHLFVDEYLIDLNATQAAVRAGYSPKTAEAIGLENLGKPRIAAAIEEAKAKRAARTEITQDRVLEELAQLAFSNVEHYTIDEHDNIKVAPGAPPNAIRAVASIKRRTIPQKFGDPIREVEFRLWDKPGQLKLAGQHVGLFSKRVELTGKDGGPIVTKQETVDLTKLSDEDLAHLQRIVGLQATSH